MSEKILIIGPSWVGDTVMAQSLFKLLKARHSDAQIDVLAPAWTFSILSCMPEITDAIELPLTHGEFKLAKRYQLGRSLKNKQYTQAIVLPNSFKSALIPFFAQIPKRTGWLGEMRFGILNDVRKLDKKKYPLMIEQYLALGLPPNTVLPQPYPYPSFYVNSQNAQEILKKHNIATHGRPILAMAAGAEFGPAKRWPETYYAQVAQEKINQGWDVWLFGSPKDRAITDEIMRLTENRCENIAGRLILSETIHLLSLVTGVISNDSGLMHIAAALNKPVLAIYGPTSPDFTPPLSAQAQVIKLNLECQPCFQRECPLNHQRCMRDISPTQILKAVGEWQL